MCDEIDYIEVIQKSLVARMALMDPDHIIGLRLFNGFIEGLPDLIVDLFGKTIVMSDHGLDLEKMEQYIPKVVDFYSIQLPWVNSFLLKRRNDPVVQNRTGRVIRGASPDTKLLEKGIWYAIDLQLHQDMSFYFDTRNLRSWVTKNLGGKTVLNTFAYTGSLGVAARIGRARKVIQTDRNRKFLSVANKSYKLNDLPVNDNEFIIRDFFSVMGQLRNEGRLFDCAILDPPFFSRTSLGRIDLVSNNKHLINKIRPLVAHQGQLICINNALFVSGKAYLSMLDELCQDGYLEIDELIDIPKDCKGFPTTICLQPPADPAPFNHSTKIAVLRVFRKDKRTE